MIDEQDHSHDPRPYPLLFPDQLPVFGGLDQQWYISLYDLFSPRIFLF